MPNKDIYGLEASELMNIPNGKNYLLAIGIDQYVHCPRLYNAAKDARDIVNILKQRFQFKAEDVKELYDGEATKRNIYSAFRSLATTVSPKDNLVIYFSGHGEFDKVFNLGYWIPVEAEKDAVDEYLPNSEIRNILSAIKSHHTFLMVDSCFSGLLFAKGGSRNISLRKERDPSRWGLTAGRNEIVTDGERGTNSPFAKSILYQLKKTDKPLGVAELCDKVLEVVSANASQTPRGEPLKVDGHQGGQFVFHLKKDEVADWKETIAAGTLQSFQSFLTKHPDGRYAHEAQSKIRNLQAENLWQKIEQAKEANIQDLDNKLRLVNQYVTAYEGQAHYEQALDSGELLEYKKDFFQVKTSEFALRRFLGKPVPAIPAASGIKDAAKQLLANWNKPATDEKEEVQQIKVEEKQKETDHKKEQKQITQQPQKVIDRNGDSKEEVEKEPSFFKKYNKYLLPLLLLPFLIWGISQWLSNKAPLPVSEEEMIPWQDTLSQLWGFKKGSLLYIPATYKSVNEFKNGVAEVVKEELTFFINDRGECVKDCPPDKTDPKANALEKAKLEYQYFLSKGDAELRKVSPNHQTAKQHFEDALAAAKGLNIDTLAAKDGINKCKKEIDKQGKAEKVRQQKEKEALDQKEYDKLIIAADKDYNKGKYDSALVKYKRAKGKVKNNREAIKGIENCNTRLAAIELAQKKEQALSAESGTVKHGGQTYKWKKMKDGKKWMTENLNYKIPDISWCYDKDQSNCKKYGRLYTWKAAKQACPAGWHLPSDEEWRAMAKHYGGCDDDAKDGGKAAYKALTDSGDSGFSALLGGRRYSDGSFKILGDYGVYWSSTALGSDNALTYCFYGPNGDLRRGSGNKPWGFSCRCIQD